MQGGWVPRWCIPGWVDGWVYRGSTPSDYAARGEVHMTAERAPERPAGAWSGWSYGARANGGLDGHMYHPAGPVGPYGPSLYICPWNAHLGPIGRDFSHFSVKLVKKDEVSPVFVNKACHSPCFQKNESKSHLLDFSDFQYLQPSLTRNY